MPYDFRRLAAAISQQRVVEEDKPWYSDAYEIVRQAAAGAAVDLPRMAGQAARWVAQDGTTLDEWGRSTVESADARAPEWAPDMEGRGGLASTLIKGARAVAPMAPAIAAGFVPGGQFVAPAVAAAQFGASSAQDTEDKLRNQGVSDADATAAGWRTGLIQGSMEGVAKAFSAAKPLLGIGSQTTAGIAARMTDTAVLKPLAKGLGLNLLVQPATEVAQDLGTEFNERSYGAAPEDAWEIAKDSAQGGLGLTLLLGPFAAGGQVSRSRRAQALKDALYSPTTPEAVRAQARDLIVAEAEKQKVDPQDIDAWLYDSRLRERAAQNKQDVIDSRALMPDRQAKAVIPSAPSASSTSTPEVAQAIESHKAAQAQREIAATQSVAPPTPEQIEEEAAAQQQIQLAQQAMAFVQQAGIQAKNALPVVKGMLSAGDIVTPALRGAIRGALVTGDVNGARKMLVDAKKARDKAQADAQKAQVAAQKAEQKIVEEGQKFDKANDEFAASIVARQTPPTEGTPANVPPPAQPGTQTSQAQSAQGTPQTNPVQVTQGQATGAVSAVVQPASVANIDPNKQIAVGRKGREKQVTAVELSDMINGASIIEKRRIARAMGWDVTENPTTGAPMLVELNSPMSFADVARAEEAETGASVSRQAIQQSLQKFGITPEMIDRATASDWGNSTVGDEELGIGRIDDSGKDSSGLRVEKSAAKAMGQGLVKDGTYMTAEQRSLYDEATRLLNEAGIGSDVALSEDPRSMAQLDGTVVTDLRDLNPAKIEQNIRELLNGVFAPNAKAHWDDGRIMWGDLPDTLKADWIDLYKENIKEHEDSHEQFTKRLSRDQRSVEADFVQLAARKPTNTSGSEAIAGKPGSNAGSDGVARIQGPTPGPVARDGDQTDVREEVVVGDGSRSAATVATKKKRRVVQPVEDVEVKGAGQSEQGVGDNTRFNRTRNVVSLGNIKDSAGKQVAVIEGTRAEMERTPHIKAAFDKLRANGLGSVVDSVESWYVTENPVDWGGAYTVINGKTAIVMSSHDMLVPSAGEYTMLHELGHAADKTHEDGGGLYSGMPEFNLRIVGNQIRGHGIVADQVIAFYESNPNSWFSKRMQYPLDRKAHGDLDAQGVREEMFAQLHATFNTPVGKEFLYDNLPDVAYFLENVNADIAQNDTTAEGLAGSTNAGAPSRFNQAKRGQEAKGSGVLATRPQGDRGQRASQVTRFNRTRNIEVQLTPAARAAAGTTKQFLKDVKDKSVLWGAFTEDLINSISGKLPAAKKYLDLVKRGQVAKTRAERSIESILDRFATLSKVERGTGPSSVNAFLKESTSKKLWGYVPEYLDNVQVDPDMETRFLALTEEAQALVQDVFRHGHENLQQLKSAVMGNINTEFDALIAGYEAEGDTAAADKERKAKQKALRDFQSLTTLSGDWPYAPLKRFGNHVVVGKSQAYLDAEERSDTKELEKLRADENHYFVAFTETKREARALRAKIEGRYSDATNFEKDGVEYGSRDMLGAFRRLRTLVDDSKDDQLSGNAKRAMNRLMVDLHLTLLGEQSSRQAERNRTGVAGADVDMMRAFATQGRASAHFIASLTNNGQIAEELRNLRNQADSFRGAEREGARDAYNEVLRRHAMGIDYRPTPFIDKALGANSVWMLLTSPAYFLTNATQPFVVSMPVLAGRNGYTRSFAAMSKAYADIAPLIKDGTITQDDYSRMPADVKGIIEELANRGRIDISLEQDLGRWRSDQDSKLAVFGKVVDKMRGVAQTVESVNRVVTAIAAARLAKQNGMTDEDATRYADEVIFTTHGDYSGFNAPRVMRSGIGRMMTQFRKFQLIQISMYAKLLNSAFKGAKPDERSAARWALGYSLTHMFILGGTLGMPGAQAIGWILRQAFGDDDEPDNPEVTLRKLVPPELADLLIKGAPAALGVDLSGRLGAGNMLSLLPYADLELSRDGYQTAATAAMGPFFGGLLPKFADGLGLINRGDYWKGMEQLAPKGLSDVSKAVRQSTEGITQRNGDITMSADEVSFLASIGQAMGLPTTSLTERSMIASAKFKADEFFNQRTAQIKKDYVQAYRSGDNEALVEAREEWARTQEARKEYGYKVQPLSELIKAPQAQAKREANRAGGVPYKKDNEQFVRSMIQ